MVFATFCVDFAIDLAILIIPIRILWNLQMRSARNAMIIGVFIIGYR